MHNKQHTLAQVYMQENLENQNQKLFKHKIYDAYTKECHISTENPRT